MNGTMIDDMHFHERAWYNIFSNELNAGLTQQEVKLEMYGKNEEVFDRIFGPGRYSKEQVEEISMRKEAQYQKDFLPHLQLIPGLAAFLNKAKATNIQLAIGTAAIPYNIDYVLDNLHLRDYFSVIVGANDVAISKPHPEVFLKAAALLGIPPAECVVFEDAPKGIEAAKRAGMKAVGIASYHTAEELQNDNVICIVKDYEDPALEELFS